MLIKFLRHGRGSGRSAVNYLMGPKDHTGQVRPGIEVLRGDPELVGAVADSLTFRNRYSSGVIAWAPEDDPTDAQIEAVLDDFERVAFAGLASNQYCWSAVLHREEGAGIHVHVVVPRVKLQSGKHFNPAPPGWPRHLNPVAELYNWTQLTRRTLQRRAAREST